MPDPAQVVGLGWLRGTYRGDPEELAGVLRPWLGEVVHREGGTRWYGRSASLLDGHAMLAWDGRGGARATVLLEVKQSGLDQLGLTRGLDLLAALVAIGWRPSRLDLYADDYGLTAAPSDVFGAMEDGQAVTHAREWSQHQGKRGSGSHTVYVGKRESDRMLRVYAKGERVRWEVEVKNEAARTLADALAALPVSCPSPADSHAGLSTVGPLFWGYVAGFVDFRDRSGSQHGARAPRLGWFSVLVGDAELVRPAVAVLVDSMERRVRWLVRQVAPTLGAAWAAMGSGWLNDLLADGLDRTSNRRAVAWGAS